MLKMFATQLSGLFKRIQEKEEFAFEDAARLIAQGAVSEGSIYLYGVKEMEAVVLEATVGAEPLRHAKPFPADISGILDSDRVLIISRLSTDPEALACAQQLRDAGIPFVAMATKVESDAEDLFDFADVSLNLQLNKGLLPDETGNRFGFPTAIAGLFTYYGLKFTFDEILAEYDEE
ncbi:DUF2529 domain-containing protein [Pseudoneobacillus sp. C159]